PELVADVPVEDRAQLHEGVAVGRVRLARLTHGLAAHLELVDLTEPTRDWTKLRGAIALRNRLSRVRQALGYELPSEVDIRALFEDDRDGGQSKPRQAAHLLHARQPTHHGLYRDRNVLL